MRYITQPFPQYNGFYATVSFHQGFNCRTQRPYHCYESLNVFAPPVDLHDEVLLVARANLERALRVKVGHEMQNVGHLLEDAPVLGASAALAVEVVHVLRNVIFWPGSLRVSSLYLLVHCTSQFSHDPFKKGISSHSVNKRIRERESKTN